MHRSPNGSFGTSDRIVEILDDAGREGNLLRAGTRRGDIPENAGGTGGSRDTRSSRMVTAIGHCSQLDRAALRDELERSVKSVEDACGRRVTAFRAPDFSILAGNLWALESLAEAGFVVDSSIFPQARPRYGIRGWDVGASAADARQRRPICSRSPSQSGVAGASGYPLRGAATSGCCRRDSSRARFARSSTRGAPWSSTAIRTSSPPKSSTNTGIAFPPARGCIRG